MTLLLRVRNWELPLSDFDLLMLKRHKYTKQANEAAEQD